MINTPKNNYVSPSKSNKSRKSISSSKRGSVLSTGKRNSSFANHVKRPSKLKTEDLKQLAKLPTKLESHIEITKETKRLIKTNQIGSKRVFNNTAELVIERANLAHELEDPANEYLRVDIQRIMQIGTEVVTLESDYRRLEDIKKELEDEITDIYKKQPTLNVKFLTTTGCKLLYIYIYI